ncbi:hypothetical protein VHEMI02433 [[Torrubiella] hemipterigena]|uniref:Rhodanese domain-containing protein n=1 Tax=[Torrubiella] hemipterigena TaxID=1531966 RepID=A0A0A1SPK1_9HYPO|nr:hypothetical protein VHEMI02433 [[Torrubiella] hemipterigena]
MASPNPLNVYRGPDSVKSYFDPDSSPPLPLVELPGNLNPYRQDGVRIYAKMMSMHPANNVKCMPALNLLQNKVVPGKTKTVVEYSSGSTVMSMSLISRAFFGIDDVRAYLSNKTSLPKIKLMQFFGINITLFGGPSQPEPLDERGGIKAAKRLTETTTTSINPNQYENDDNWRSHVKWTGPQILRQLPEINVICAGMGTSGTMTGLGTFFKDNKPSVFRLGVCTAPGDRVPGPRSYALLAPVEFPWKKSVDHIEEVGSHDSYTLSLAMCRNGIVCGPSSGFNLQGLYNFIGKRKAEGTLSEMAGEDGEVHCVFLCCDLPYQYIGEYFDKLDATQFPAITNESLLNVDCHRYDERWERDPVEALGAYYDVATDLIGDLVSIAAKLPSADLQMIPLKTDSCIIDFRQEADFAAFSLPKSINMPYVTKDAPNPFVDPEALSTLWKRLEETFLSPPEEIAAAIKDKRVLFLCYDGDSARVATSVLRAKGIEADNVRGGFKALQEMNSSRPDTPVNEANVQELLGQSKTLQV